MSFKLFGVAEVEDLDRTEIARRELRNLLTSYADEADLFNEILQNALDSVLTALQHDIYAESEVPEITVGIGRRRSSYQYLYVGDNGLGMSRNTAFNLTIPGFSNAKDRGSTLGYKGVGASYFFAASKRISLSTVSSDGEETRYTARGSHAWITDPEEPEPIVTEEFDCPDSIKHLLPVKRGTGVLYQFHPGVHPSTLENLVKISDGSDRELRNWVSFLCARTVMGAVRRLTQSRVTVRIQLELDEGTKESVCELDDFNLDANKIGYPFPYQVVRTHGTVDEIDNAPPELKHRHARRYSAIQKRWSVQEFLDKFTTVSDETKYKLEQYLSFVDGYLSYSTDVFKEINQRLGGRTNLLRHGIRIAVDGVPQGRVIDLSLTSSQGLDRQTHIVIAFNRLELDLGRKISADEEIAAAIREIGNKVVGHLKEYRWAMKKKDRPDVTSDLEGWQDQVESRLEDSIYPIFCEKLGLAPAFEVDPDSENEVIALFTWLCSKDLLKGYKIRAISGFARYDALMRVVSSDEVLRNNMDPLSIRADDDAVEKDWAVCEFKQQFADLIQDFDDKKKNPAEIDIAVCWHVQDVNCRRGRLEMCYGDAYRDHRPNYGASYIWRDDNDTTSFPVISLRNLFLELLARHERDSGTPGLGVDQLNRILQRDRDASI